MYQPDDMYDAPEDMTEIPMKGLPLTGAEARVLDSEGTLYVDIDPNGDCTVYGVFGSESGHCYATFCELEEAEAWVKEEAEAWASK